MTEVSRLAATSELCLILTSWNYRRLILRTFVSVSQENTQAEPPSAFTRDTTLKKRCFSCPQSSQHPATSLPLKAITVSSETSQVHLKAIFTVRFLGLDWWYKGHIHNLPGTDADSWSAETLLLYCWVLYQPNWELFLPPKELWYKSLMDISNSSHGLSLECNRGFLA